MEMISIDLNSNVTSDAIDPKWWEQKESDAYRSIFSIAKNIETNQAYRHLDNIRFAKLYANKDLDNFLIGTAYSYLQHRISLNVVKPVIDTACAMISKGKTRTQFLTKNGNFTQQRRARDLTLYNEGVFYDLKLYELFKIAFRDACIWGTGLIKFNADTLKQRVTAERVLPDEILVDDCEAAFGKPRQIHQKRYIDRDVAIAMFPGKEKEIRAVTPFRPTTKIYRTGTDLIKIIESWHLPSGPEAKDGKHAITLDSCTLLLEEYNKDWFPFVILRWSEPIVGWYGDGIAQDLVGIQLEINNIVQRIKESMDVISVPRVYLENSSQIASQHITDEIAGITRYTGTPPIIQTAQAQHPEVYQHLEYLYNKAFYQIGVSQLSATSKKPSGLDSKVALREYQDIGTERFALVGERFQQAHLDASRIIVELSRTLADSNKDLGIKVKMKNDLKFLRWKDVELDTDDYIMQLFPTNLLPRTPEGQLQTVQELIQAGIIPQEVALSLLDFPDLQGWISIQTAGVENIKFIIEQVVESGTYTAPEPFMDLRTGIMLAQATINKGYTQELPEDRLEMLRRFIGECEALLTPPAQPQLDLTKTTNMALPVSGMEQKTGLVAKPSPLPVNDLLPIAQ